MFAIEVFCGSKFGGWHAMSERFGTAEAAQRVATLEAAEERRHDLTPVARRVRPTVARASR